MTKHKKVKISPDVLYEGRHNMENDIDRMVNEGLGGGHITPHVNGKVEVEQLNHELDHEVDHEDLN